MVLMGDTGVCAAVDTHGGCACAMGAEGGLVGLLVVTTEGGNAVTAAC